MENVSFRLLDRKTNENSFFLNSDGSKDEDKKLDFTNTYGVLNPFFIIGEGGKRQHFRYIAGCDTFDVAEQDKQKIPFNKESGLIEFKAGTDIILDKKVGGILIKFLSLHPENRSSIYHNPDLHDAKFFTYDPKEKVNEEYDQAQAEDEAAEIFASLKNDPQRMRTVALLFGETAGLSGEKEIYLGLRALAKDKPSLFVNSIASREKQVLSDVILAGNLDVIQKDAKGWIFKEGEGVIFPTTTKKRNEAENELVGFLMSKEGEIYYSQMVIKTRQAEIGAGAPSGTILPPGPEVDPKHGIVTNPEE